MESYPHDGGDPYIILEMGSGSVLRFLDAIEKYDLKCSVDHRGRDENMVTVYVYNPYPLGIDDFVKLPIHGIFSVQDGYSRDRKLTQSLPYV